MKKNNEIRLLQEQLQEQELRYWQAQRNGCDEAELKTIVEEIKKLKGKILELQKDNT